MRMLFIIPEEFGGERWGGVTTYTIELVQELHRLGHDVSVLTPGSKKIRFLWRGIPIYKIDHLKTLSLLGNLVKKITYKFSPNSSERLIWAWNVFLFVKKQKPYDLVESSEWGSSTLFISLFGVKTVVRLHKSWVMYKKDNELPMTAGDRFVDLLERFCILTASLITSPTRFMPRQYPLLMFVRSIFRKFARIVPNGITCSKLPKKLNMNKFGKYILVVGRVEIGKGSLDIIDAFTRVAKQYPTLNLVFVGEDTRMYINGVYMSCVNAIQKKISEHHLNHRVFIVPRQDRKALLSYYMSCFFYCAPSRGYENFPLSLIEAMNSGKASVVSNSGGLPEIVDTTQSGVLFKSGSSHDLVEKMQLLLDDSVFRRQCEKRALQKRAVFDIRLITTQMLAAYQSVR